MSRKCSTFALTADIILQKITSSNVSLQMVYCGFRGLTMATHAQPTGNSVWCYPIPTELNRPQHITYVSAKSHSDALNPSFLGVFPGASFWSPGCSCTGIWNTGLSCCSKSFAPEVLDDPMTDPPESTPTGVCRAAKLVQSCRNQRVSRPALEIKRVINVHILCKYVCAYSHTT